jgi:UDP-N-acetylglucosamine/UDP-N-acetylgalactosamine diphosphorylase
MLYMRSFFLLSSLLWSGVGMGVELVSLAESSLEKKDELFSGIDLQELERQKGSLFAEEPSFSFLSPFTQYEKSGCLENLERGKRIISEGKLGCLIVAGGQGSRLNYAKPKGLYPVTLIQKKPLFQILAEKVLAAGNLAGRPLPVAIMTSLGNHKETVRGFEENHYFGLSRDQVYFFSQGELPLLDLKGEPFFETPQKLATGPDGNASSLKHFVDSGVWDKWSKMGVSYIHYIHVDNALADPFDAELAGFHEKTGADVIVKCIERENPAEKLGVMFQQKEKVVVVEYSEISKEEQEARNEDGSLRNLCANIGAYSFSMEFVQEVASSLYEKLPFHKAWKAARYLTSEGTTKMADQPIAWKFEKFIFDVLPEAKEVKALLYPRKACFAPLKNAEGPDSLEAVQKALQERDREVFRQVSGVNSSASFFELDPAFYYFTPELQKKWEGLDVSDGTYVIP